MIRIRGLSKRYGSLVVLEHLDLEIASGEWFLFLGPNGAGKTTTIKLLMGLLRPSAGSVEVAGLDVRRDHLRLRRIVGYLPQTFKPYAYLTGREYLGFVGSVHGLPRRERSARIEELLDLFEFQREADRLTRAYSQGMLKKIGLAAALLHRPEILVLDEPTGDMDARSASMVRNVLRGLAQRGTTILMSTHILGITEKMCDKVGILHHGRLEVLATQEELSSRFPGLSLEEVFLSVTGQIEPRHIEGFLTRWREGGGLS